MKRIAFLLAALTCMSLALADNTQAVRKALDANYKAVTAALKSNKIDKIGAMMTDDYTVTDASGHTMTKPQIIAQFKAMGSQLHNAKWMRTIASLTVNKTGAIAIVNGSFSGDVDTPDGKTHAITQTATTKDTWVKTPKGYLLKLSEVQKNAMTMDGKPMRGR